ncbi:hypothetical protein [Catenovulum maritimum]|uniref:Uncharacterized protein n=1 Tax=Catenovulum maritimum TaxID=1513271 RepID=A0A0J8H0L3_9ALTE|nr:hypothetical protein [Catenovulum maritimum]KMT66548.1 hypothetical protein XM47_03160 [Catenovulum maritimum]
MSLDLIIPFIPRTVQAPIKPVRLNVKKIDKDPKLSEDEEKPDLFKHSYTQLAKRELSNTNQDIDPDEKKNEADAESLDDDRPKHIDILV